MKTTELIELADYCAEKSESGKRDIVRWYSPIWDR